MERDHVNHLEYGWNNNTKMNLSEIGCVAVE